jgi:hypothetical protein
MHKIGWWEMGWLPRCFAFRFLLHFDSTQRRFMDGMAGTSLAFFFHATPTHTTLGGCAHRIERLELVGKRLHLGSAVVDAFFFSRHDDGAWMGGLGLV